MTTTILTPSCLICGCVISFEVIDSYVTSYGCSKCRSFRVRLEYPRPFPIHNFAFPFVELKEVLG